MLFVPENQKLCVAHFIVILTLLQRSETKPASPLRYDYAPQGWSLFSPIFTLSVFLKCLTPFSKTRLYVNFSLKYKDSKRFSFSPPPSLPPFVSLSRSLSHTHSELKLEVGRTRCDAFKDCKIISMSYRILGASNSTIRTSCSGLSQTVLYCLLKLFTLTDNTSLYTTLDKYSRSFLQGSFVLVGKESIME